MFVLSIPNARITLLRWSEINFELAIITLPGSRTKNRRTHIVPLSDRAADILNVQPRRDGRDYVFGEGQGGFSGWSRCKERLDQAINIPAWVIHDIRRTVATGMSKIGILPHVVEAVLNHVSGHKGGVAGIYNLHTYEAEKVTALTRWADHVAAIVT